MYNYARFRRIEKQERRIKKFAIAHDKQCPVDEPLMRQKTEKIHNSPNTLARKINLLDGLRLAEFENNKNQENENKTIVEFKTACKLTISFVSLLQLLKMKF